MPDAPDNSLWLCLSALVAGAINAVAGGGTLLTFPALLAALSPLGAAEAAVVANATSTVALVPGSASSVWGYRREFRPVRRWALILMGPSLVGGVVGALLVTRLPPEYFAALVPWLILTAALLFLAQPTLTRLTGLGKGQAAPPPGAHAAAVAFQLLVAVYGGYFGAGIGILMISALSLMGVGDIHRMNALKTFLGVCINGVSVAVFVIDGKVDWPKALLMAATAVAGGYLGARVARRLPHGLVRWLVIGIGFALAAYYFGQQVRG
jgi:uncharacterized membrane protein YfcA